MAAVAACGIAPIPDVVVTDFSMPEMDGLELITWVEGHYPGCRIVMITGHAALAQKRLEREVHSLLLQKPVPPLELIEAISEVAA